MLGSVASNISLTNFRPRQHLARWGWQLCLAYGLAVIAQVQLDQIDLFILWATVCVFLVLELLHFAWRPSREGGYISGWLVFACLLLYALWYVLDRLFGEIAIPAILFHMQHSVESNGVAGSFIKDLFYISAQAMVVFAGWYKLSQHTRWMKSRLVPFLLILMNPFLWIIGSYVVDAASPPPAVLSSLYQDPLTARAPPMGKQKNLIHIFLESAERTLLDDESFAGVAGPLKTLEAQGFSATNMQQAEMTGWTLAGQVSSNCGVPLFPLGIFQHNNFEGLNSFLPKAVCLTDILKRDGYETSFLHGAVLGFAGTSSFLDSHSYDNKLGFEELQSRYPGERNIWGLEDEQLFDAAFDEITRLSKGKRPFSVTMAAIGGHMPHGFVSPICRKDPAIIGLPNQTLQAFACTNLLTLRFVERLKKQALLDSAVVVIQSDHLAMRNDVTRELEAHDRRNLFMVLGPHLTPRGQDKPSVMFDAFPTILSALGYSLPEGRAGLGASLLTDAPTLTGRLGLRDLDRSILADQTLRNRLWGVGS